MEGILICGPDAERLPLNETLKATLESVGACRIRITEHSKAGAQARFEAPDAELDEKIEDKLWSIHDENTEFVTRAMEAGTALTRIFEDAVASGAISIDDMFDDELRRDTRHQSAAAPHPDSRLGGSRAAAVPGSLPRQGPAHGVLRDDRPQRLPAGAQQDLFASATPRRRRPGTPPTAATAASSTIPRASPPAATCAPI